MEEIIKNLTDEQKEELINALNKVDMILDDQGYMDTKFYNELAKMMYYLGQWC